MGSSAPSKTQITVFRYADYVETRHSALLEAVGTYRDQVMDYSESPYLSADLLDSDVAILGTGYLLSDYPSLFDMFGKFMSGLDIDSLFSEIFGDTLKIPEVDALTTANLSLTDDQMVEDLIPEFAFSMRSLNAVISSSFIMGKAALEERRTKLRAVISSNFILLLIPDITKRWIGVLNHKKKVIFSYAFILKLQFMARSDTDRYNYRLTTRHSLWPFTVLEYERAALAALQGTTPKKRDITRKRSPTSKVLLVMSYWLTGMTIGSYFGPWGAVIGAVIGIVVGLAIMFFE